MNNNQIDNTSYYQLPCGLFLEDFIEYKHLDFKWGSALKYKFRAGKKDGESVEKEENKIAHYVNEITARDNRLSQKEVYRDLCLLFEEANLWNPKGQVREWFKPYDTTWRIKHG